MDDATGVGQFAESRGAFSALCNSELGDIAVSARLLRIKDGCVHFFYLGVVFGEWVMGASWLENARRRCCRLNVGLVQVLFFTV